MATMRILGALLWFVAGIAFILDALGLYDLGLGPL
jgi:hypothetical protein